MESNVVTISESIENVVNNNETLEPESGEATTYSIELDENGYCTGNWASVGGDDNWIKVDSLPTEDKKKFRCYKYENGNYTFDEEKFNKKVDELNSKALTVAKEALIAQSKQNLAIYLATHTVTSTCHGGTAEYSITSEKQSYLASMIVTAQMAQASGIDYQPSWNATGQVCTYDWTLEQLQQLAFEIESVVRPLVSKQQTMEASINNCASIEALNEIDISFEAKTNE